MMCWIYNRIIYLMTMMMMMIAMKVEESRVQWCELKGYIFHRKKRRKCQMEKNQAGNMIFFLYILHSTFICMKWNEGIKFIEWMRKIKDRENVELSMKIKVMLHWHFDRQIEIFLANKIQRWTELWKFLYLMWFQECVCKGMGCIQKFSKGFFFKREWVPGNLLTPFSTWLPLGIYYLSLRKNPVCWSFK